MTGWFLLVAAGVLLTLGGAFWRLWRGPGEADRMMAAQLAGTSGVAVVLLLSAALSWDALDVAIVLALLAAFAAVAFVKAASPDGAGDPEEAPAEAEGMAAGRAEGPEGGA